MFFKTLKTIIQDLVAARINLCRLQEVLLGKSAAFSVEGVLVRGKSN